MICLITVQHTGSTFFCRLLERHFGPYGNLKTPGEVFYYDHCWPFKLPLIRERMEGRKLITTVRDKAATRASWQRRGVHDMHDFNGQWSAWERFILPAADCVVSIDDDRERRLADLSRLLGIDFETDWTPVNVSLMPRYGHNGRRVSGDRSNDGHDARRRS